MCGPAAEGGFPEQPTRQEAFKQFLKLLIYAESRALLVGLARGAPWNPINEMSQAVRTAYEEQLVPGTEAFGARAMALLRETSLAALEPALRRGGPHPYDYPIARGQLGCFAGIEETFHEAGQIAVWHRDNDPRLMRIAIQIFDTFWLLVRHPSSVS